MSKKMTPCEKLGYKVGDKFTVIKDSYFEKGTIVALSEDDGSEVPWFTCGGVRRALIIGSNPDVEPTPSKLKPAKQALADAIHQNGGWPESELLDFATSNAFGEVLCSASHPERKGNVWVNGDYYRLISCIKGTIANWHQTILSRDEYFTAYPEQVMVEIRNETEQKVEVEMKSESEATINASDWHKNGELPPAGAVCEWLECSQTGWQTVTVAGYYLNAAWLVPKGKEPITVYNPTGFRPLRTERDNAIDEMMEHCDYLGSRDFAGKLFDAGYRKEVK